MAFGSAMLVNASTTGTNDAFVAKLSPTGNWQWAIRLGETNYDALHGIALDGAGQPYVTGGFQSTTVVAGATVLTNINPGTFDVFVGALTTNGTWRWATQMGSPSSEIGLGIAVNAAGQAIVTGSFSGRSLQFGASSATNSSVSGNGPSNGEAFVARLDASGAWQWVLTLTPTGRGEKDGQRVVLAADGEVYVAGSYWDQATFGPATLPGNIPFPNIFLAHVYDQVALATITGAPSQLVTLTGTGFVGVTAALFNGVSAIFTVKSATRLEATVSSGATSGPITVRTSAGTAVSPIFSQATPLATTITSAGQLGLWPNPVGTTDLLQVRLPATPPVPTRVEARNLLGQLIR